MLTIKYFIDDQEVPEYKPIRPFNSLLNIILHKDSKGVSNLYKCMYSPTCDILGNICTKWYDRAGLIFTTQEIRSSFVKTHCIIDDIYLKYIQFRTLHYRFLLMTFCLKLKLRTPNYALCVTLKKIATITCW